MLASRRFQVVLGCYASAISLVLASRKAYNPQHIVLSKNGQVQDVDPSLYFHERAKPRASVIRSELQHTQQYQLKTIGHTSESVTRSPKISISRVNDGEAKPTRTVENKPQAESAHVADPSDSKAIPPAHTRKEMATNKKSETVVAKLPGSANKPEPQRRFGPAERRFQAQVSSYLVFFSCKPPVEPGSSILTPLLCVFTQESDFDDFAQAPASITHDEPEQVRT